MDVPKTSLDELVERHFDQGIELKPIGLPIRIYEPERQENGEIVWQLIRNLPGKLRNLILAVYLKAESLVTNISDRFYL